MGRNNGLSTAGEVLRRSVAATRRWSGGCVDALWPVILQQEMEHAAAKGWRFEAGRDDTPSTCCRRCGATVAVEGRSLGRCPFCVDLTIHWDTITRLGAYQEPMNRWILGMKFGRQWWWGQEFGRRLAGATGMRVGVGASMGAGAGRTAACQCTLVCPVPMHWIRRVRRGYNQAGLIAEAFATGTGYPLVPLLKRVRYTPAQTSVPVSQRARNVSRSFEALNVDLTGWTVWLVDDVKTTGATLNACARLLRQAGACRVHAAVVAVADPHGSDFQYLV